MHIFCSGWEKWKGDGTCDDKNNFAGCDYDGGDCCGPNVKCASSKSHCKCKDPASPWLDPIYADLLG